ncbi:hypothetical protein C8J56DRAFT_934717 [Mycena floridula]|nr:hypothetical protein C8J56DRAFT_934717 [Mycena floridula]
MSRLLPPLPGPAPNCPLPAVPPVPQRFMKEIFDDAEHIMRTMEELSRTHVGLNFADREPFAVLLAPSRSFLELGDEEEDFSDTREMSYKDVEEEDSGDTSSLFDWIPDYSSTKRLTPPQIHIIIPERPESTEPASSMDSSDTSSATSSSSEQRSLSSFNSESSAERQLIPSEGNRMLRSFSGSFSNLAKKLRIQRKGDRESQSSHVGI